MGHEDEKAKERRIGLTFSSINTETSNAEWQEIIQMSGKSRTDFLWFSVETSVWFLVPWGCQRWGRDWNKQTHSARLASWQVSIWNSLFQSTTFVQKEMSHDPQKKKKKKRDIPMALFGVPSFRQKEIWVWDETRKMRRVVSHT
jgi:hypothetical protein